MRGQPIAINPELLQQRVHLRCQRAGIVTTVGSVGITLSGQVYRDHVVGRCQAGHDLAPCIPALRKAGQKDDGVAPWPPAADVMQPNAVDVCEPVDKARRRQLGPRVRREIRQPFSSLCIVVFPVFHHGFLYQCKKEMIIS